MKTYDECFEEEQRNRKPGSWGWVQWKGTHLCMDLHCVCGELTHVCGDFAYAVKCYECGRQYYMPCDVKLVEIESDDTHCCVESVWKE